MSTHIQHETPPGPDTDHRPAAVRDADTGLQAWRRVVHTQRAATPDHSTFIALAGEVVDTLRSLDSLAGLLIGQTAHYPATVLGAGGRLYDDESANPAHRIRSAVLALAESPGRRGAGGEPLLVVRLPRRHRPRRPRHRRVAGRG